MIRRRHLLISVPVLAAIVQGSPAFGAPLQLRWGDLMPGGGPAATPENLLPHDETDSTAWQAVNQAPAPTRPELDGQDVSIRGYMVPIGYKPGTQGQSIAGFLLAPFVGACVHVPPPPSNQIILANYPDGFPMESRIWFDPVTVTGRLAVTPLETSLARIGYQLEATDVAF